MASTSLHDFDVLEERFHHLKRATIVVSDYDLLRNDFKDEFQLCNVHSNEEIDQWMLGIN